MTLSSSLANAKARAVRKRRPAAGESEADFKRRCAREDEIEFYRDRDPSLVAGGPRLPVRYDE
jgi:hypothetical protein